MTRSTRQGFSLVELLVAIGIMVVIFALGLFVDTRFYRRASLDTERDTVASLLSKARGEALSNVDGKTHGFRVATSTYVVFEGDSYAARVASADEDFPMSAGVAASGTQEIVFKALEGSVDASGTILLSNDSKSLSVGVNQEGMITW